ncbi:hypothetical protein BV25DRAFT_1911550 [Artomyces pyxidatus]|uniref:Uncharacterized protein n=1 Tax=Artomyces pyxidatus TaxID=48021 RepID=A0ACB8TGW7_9AGAM|nr:hypothetical protein BV25DRAFT_1911550 [Artomyces pyxidatus]
MSDTGSFPPSVQAWRAAHTVLDPHWSKPWETLRPFFLRHGYNLYIPGTRGAPGLPNGTRRPTSSSAFRFYGEIGPNFESQFAGEAGLFGARDRENRDVVIKVVSKGEEGAEELRILQYLNAKPLRNDPANATAMVFDFLQYLDWTFVVVPQMTACDRVPMYSTGEALDFCEQLLAASLNSHVCAHLDITTENIMMNYYGDLPPVVLSRKSVIEPPEPFRFVFPVKYSLTNFAMAKMFPSDRPLEDCITNTPMNARDHRAPEVSAREQYNPFFADVYQTARLMYAWFVNAVPFIPGWLELLQDMSSRTPASRISAATALARLHAIRAAAPQQELLRTNIISLRRYPPIPLKFEDAPEY